jgi:hypothetical protein
MMVMMMAMTPSLNASSRPLPIPGLVYRATRSEHGRKAAYINKGINLMEAFAFDEV